MENKTENFNWVLYLANNPELREQGIATKEEAEDHWQKVGKSRGLTCEIQSPEKVLILGLQKTGTTALFSKIQNGLSGKHKAFFEPVSQSAEDKKNMRKAILDSKQCIVKDLFIPGEDYGDYKNFKKKIVIVRDPRDRIISKFLFSHANHLFYQNKRINKCEAIFNLLLKKQAYPSHMPFLSYIKQFVHIMGRPQFFENLLGIQEYEALGDFIKNNPDYFVLRYEDLVDQKFDELELYLGFPIAKNAEVHQALSRVIRSKGYGSWKNWFTQEDIIEFKRLYNPILKDLGYSEDWELNANPVIEREHSVGYVQKLWNEWTFKDDPDFLLELNQKTKHQANSLPVLPADFDWEYYLSNSLDLLQKGIITQKDAEQHWLRNGHKENRKFSLVQKPKSILILSLAKCGSTIVSHTIHKSIDSICIPEPKEFKLPEVDSTVVSKVHINHFWDKPEVLGQYCKKYEKTVLLIRDPRDRLISSLFFLKHQSEQNLKQFYKRVLAKEKNPRGVSLFDSLDLEKTQKPLEFLIKLHEENPNLFVLKYEDFVNGNTSKLEKYLGFKLNKQIKEEKKFVNIYRNGCHDQWKDYMLPQDVSQLKPIFQQFIEKYDYQSNWELRTHPKLDPKFGSEYLRNRHPVLDSIQEGASKMLLILPYFGARFPVYFQQYLDSIRGSQILDLLLITNIRTSGYNLPPNVRVEHRKSFQIFGKEIQERINESTGYQVNAPSRPYKFCDFKPFYNLIFPEQVKSYSHWGWGDCDVIYGDLDSYLEDFTQFDFIGGSGHFSFLRVMHGSDWWQEDPDVFSKLSEKRNWAIDETDFTRIRKSFVQKGLWKHKNLAPYTADVVAPCREPRKTHSDERPSKNYYKHKLITTSQRNTSEPDPEDQFFVYSDGKLWGYINGAKDKEYVYLHLQKRTTLKVKTTKESFIINSDGFFDIPEQLKIPESLTIQPEKKTKFSVYTAVNLESVKPNNRKDGFNYLRALVHSFKKTNADQCELSVICVNYENPSPLAQKLLDFLERENIKVIFHDLSPNFKAAVYKMYDEYTWWFAAYVRYDLDVIHPKDEVVLYVDWDCYFIDSLDLSDFKKIKRIGIQDQGFNNGVLAINIEFLKKEKHQFTEFLKEQKEEGISGGDMDFCLKFWKGRFDSIPTEYNWRPTKGINPNAKIIHSHEPKPDIVEKIITGDVYQLHNWRKRMFRFDHHPEGILHYYEMYQKLLERDTKQKTKIRLIIPYFGESFPSFFQQYLYSVEKNQVLDVLFITNIDLSNYIIPENVTIIERNNFDEFSEDLILRAKQRLNLDIRLDNPYKLCDLKPLYGALFQEYLYGYSHWAFGDCDVIYGDLDGVLEDLATQDVILHRGSFCVFRNDTKCRDLYRAIPNLEKMLASSLHHSVDEPHFQPMLREKVKNGELKGRYIGGSVADVLAPKRIPLGAMNNASKTIEFYQNVLLTPAQKEEAASYVGQYFVYQEGRIWSYVEGKKKKEYAYIHLPKRNYLIKVESQNREFALVKNKIVDIAVAEKESQRMKLFFCLCDDGMKAESVYVRMLKVAIISARETNNFDIVVVYDGNNEGLLSWLHKCGITVVRYQSKLLASINAQEVENSRKRTARGVFLRLEIPFILRNILKSDDKFALYADVDVLFTKEIGKELEDLHPRFLSMAVEQQPTRSLSELGNNHFNSGVILFNIDSFGARMHKVLDWCRSNMESLIVTGLDQKTLNVCFKNEVDLLSPELNWRPYWGSNSQAGIMHMHGIKPTHDLGLMKTHKVLKRFLRDYTYTVVKEWNKKDKIISEEFVFKVDQISPKSSSEIENIEQKKSEKVLLIMPYFGQKFPNTFQYYLDSLANVEVLDLLLITDIETENFKLPPNTRVIQKKFDSFKTEILNKVKTETGETVSLDRPYKLCDFKPLYEFLFSDYLEGYSYWAYGDCDVIYGDLNRYLADLNEYDVIGDLGHLTILRRNLFTEFWKRLPGFIDCLKKPRNFSLDEILFTQYLRQLSRHKLVRMKTTSTIVADIVTPNFGKDSAVKFLHQNNFVTVYQKRFQSVIPKNQYFEYKDKKIIGFVDGKQDREYCYIHFHQREMEVKTTNSDLLIVPNELRSLEVNKTQETALKAYKHVFIGGLHRSGTSIMHRLLRDQSNTSGFQNTGFPQDEGQYFLRGIIPFDHECGGLMHLGYSTKAHLTEESVLISAETREKVLGRWLPNWDTSKEFLLEKTPALNLLRTRFWQSMFPGSYFLLLTRHPIAQAYALLSMMKQPTTFKNVSHLIKHWVHCHKIFRTDKQYVENLILIRYEDFVAKPGGYLQQITEFLKSTKPFYLTRNISPNTNKKYFDLWMEEKMKNPKNTKKLEKHLEKEINDWGYSFDLANPYCLETTKKNSVSKQGSVPANSLYEIRIMSLFAQKISKGICFIKKLLYWSKRS